MHKKDLRVAYNNKRLALSQDEKTILDELMLKELARLDLSRVKYLHVFLPIARRNEPDTLRMIDWLLSQYPGMSIVVPKVVGVRMDNFLYTSEKDLVISDWGIPEPVVKGQTQVDVRLIDAVLVPLLTFDLNGHRVGYGKGFYDRFLNLCKEDVLKVGLCYFQPVNRIKDYNPFDVKLDLCITPNKTWDFGNSELKK